MDMFSLLELILLIKIIVILFWVYTFPYKSKTNNSTKVILKKEDEILTKGTRTLQDYFSMDTSNSGSVSPNWYRNSFSSC